MIAGTLVLVCLGAERRFGLCARHRVHVIANGANLVAGELAGSVLRRGDDWVLRDALGYEHPLERYLGTTVRGMGCGLLGPGGPTAPSFTTACPDLPAVVGGRLDEVA